MLNRLLRKWFNRHPYVPAVLKPVKPVVADVKIDRMTTATNERIEKATQQSRTLAASVVGIHDDLLKILGNRA